MTKLWGTELRAINPKTGELTTYIGPDIDAITQKEAEEYCQNNNLGYLTVVGEVLSEMPCFPGTYTPDYSKKIDYEAIKYN